MTVLAESPPEAMTSDREAYLAERVRQLEEILVPTGFVLPVEWRLTPSQERIFRVLLAREVATYGAIEAALYSDRPGDPPHASTLKVLVYHVRRKLSASGVIIENLSGQGYRLSDRRRWRAQLLASSSREELS